MIYESDILSFTDGLEEDRIKWDLNFSGCLGRARPVRHSKEADQYYPEPLKVSLRLPSQMSSDIF